MDTKKIVCLLPAVKAVKNYLREKEIEFTEDWLEDEKDAKDVSGWLVIAFDGKRKNCGWVQVRPDCSGVEYICFNASAAMQAKMEDIAESDAKIFWLATEEVFPLYLDGTVEEIVCKIREKELAKLEEELRQESQQKHE